jgi:hypothetical protein
MVRPQIADKGDGLQIWRVAANILNNYDANHVLMTVKEAGLHPLTETLHFNVYL